MRRLALAWVVLALALPAEAQSPEEVFANGNQAYAEGRYDDAAEAYRAVLRMGIRDARAEYNLGNTALKLGRLGEAILHFERALRLAPSDPEIRANLEIARARRVDRVEVPEGPAPLRWLRDLQNKLGPDRQATIGLVLLWLAAAIVTWCWARPGRFGPAWGWLLATVLSLATVVGVSWRITLSRIEGIPTAVVMRGSVEVLAGPGENNASLFTVHEGLTLEVRAEREGWTQVSLPNGLNGWLPREAIERVR